MQATSIAQPGQLAQHEVGRLRAAALHTTKVHPGPVGELIARELRAHADFGYRFGSDGLIERLAADILRMPARTVAATGTAAATATGTGTGTATATGTAAAMGTATASRPALSGTAR